MILKSKYPNWFRKLFNIKDKTSVVPLYCSLKSIYNLPDWVIKAVEKQQLKILNSKK